MRFYNKHIHRCVHKAGVVSETLGKVLCTWTSSACCGLSCTLNPNCLGSEDFWELGTSVQPPQLLVSTRHVDRQLFLQSGGEAAVFTFPLDFLCIPNISGLRSIAVVFRRVVYTRLMWINITYWSRTSYTNRAGLKYKCFVCYDWSVDW